MNFTCGESCGWIAALVACVCFGSFGVPIKGAAATRVDIDPLVMQSYKTIMCFLTSWTVLLLGEEFTYTPWGIVSGIAWVPSGTAAIYAIRNAGLAVSQGTWSALIVLVSFTWGIFIFDEHVKSKVGAIVGICLMVAGLWGMSYFSSPEERMHTNASTSYDGFEPVAGTDVDGIGSVRESFHDEHMDTSVSSGSCGSIEMETDIGMTAVDSPRIPLATDRSTAEQPSEYVGFLGFACSRRHLGLACAVFNGLWGGSIMVPMHYSSGNTSGLGYVISFAIGAMIVLIFMWACRLLYHFGRTTSIVKAYASLPCFHFQIMWIPGGIAGTLWSVGNICSMLSVQGLGEGVGYSVIQAAMLVSGLWGILFYKEVTGTRTRLKWLVAAVLTVSGILLLSYEHRNG